MAEQKLCTVCGTIGTTKRNMKGSVLTELLLWCFFLLPGLIYSIWRHSTVSQVCRNCGNSAVIPLNSPVAQQTLASRGTTNEVKTEAKPRAAVPAHAPYESRNRVMYKAGQALSKSLFLKLAAWAFGILIGFAVLGAIIGQMGRSSSATVSSSPVTNSAAKNDADLLIARCGQPSSDYSSQYDNPAPLMPGRTVEYKEHQLRFLFIPRGQVGDGPPYDWKLVGMTDMTAVDPSQAEVVTASEAARRMPCFTGK